VARAASRVALVLALLAALVVVPAALGWHGRPRTAPPKAPGGPPPAWIETASRSAWLAFGSYCWTSGGVGKCADMIAPQSRTDLPVVRVARGRTLRVHLGFPAKSVSVSVRGRVLPARLSSNRRVVSWRAARAGILTVFVRPTSGDASYHARLRLG
jgi:hypothetical protein